MKTIAIAATLAALALPGLALAQALDGNSLTWLAGSRVATMGAAQVFEAFIGPQNGNLTGTALAQNGAYTEYHKLGPGPDGKWGLSVANPRTNMQWNFTPLKAIEKDRVIFQTADGGLTITYFKKDAGAVGSLVERKGADGKVSKTEYDFRPLPAPK